MGLPIPKIDFTDQRQAYLHDEITCLAETVARAQLVNIDQDNALEELVMELHGLSPAERAHTRNELKEIERYGTLLGWSDRKDEEDTE